MMLLLIVRRERAGHQRRTAHDNCSLILAAPGAASPLQLEAILARGNFPTRSARHLESIFTGYRPILSHLGCAAPSRLETRHSTHGPRYAANTEYSHLSVPTVVPRS
jgi:hypothetical protein